MPVMLVVSPAFCMAGSLLVLLEQWFVNPGYLVAYIVSISILILPH